jgi:hypothetical protein
LPLKLERVSDDLSILPPTSRRFQERPEGFWEGIVLDGRICRLLQNLLSILFIDWKKSAA